jgi:hypothetical protein
MAAYPGTELWSQAGALIKDKSSGHFGGTVEHTDKKAAGLLITAWFVIYM